VSVSKITTNKADSTVNMTPLTANEVAEMDAVLDKEPMGKMVAFDYGAHPHSYLQTLREIQTTATS
jgi:hypothetical protein